MNTFFLCARFDRFRSSLSFFSRGLDALLLLLLLLLSLTLSLSLSRRVPLLLFFHEARRERLFPFHVSLLLAKFVLVLVVRLVQISIVRESPDGKLRFQTGRPVVAQILSLRKRQRRARAFIPLDLEKRTLFWMMPRSRASNCVQSFSFSILRPDGLVDE